MTKDNGDFLVLDLPDGQRPAASANAQAHEAKIGANSHMQRIHPENLHGKNRLAHIATYIDWDTFNVLEDRRRLVNMPRATFIKLLLRRAIAANLHNILE